jgi:glutaredoxin-related protein
MSRNSRGKTMSDNGKSYALYKALQENEQLRARLTKHEQAVSVPQQWRDTMAELAADLEIEIESRRSGELDRRIERDLIVVREARALLAAQEQGHE